MTVKEFVCLPLGYILHLCIHPSPYAWFPRSKSHNLLITTGRLSGWPVPLQSFVLMSFLHDIQTSSCLKPPDPFMLCFCHRKQQPDNSGGGARLGPQIILMGSLQENKQGVFHAGSLVLLCSEGHEESTGTGPDPFHGDFSM